MHVYKVSEYEDGRPFACIFCWFLLVAGLLLLDVGSWICLLLDMGSWIIAS